jgi:iron(III) transport system permease protein
VKPPRENSFRLFTASIWVVFGLVVIAPMACVLASTILVEGRLTLAPYSQVLYESRQWGLLGTSLVIAAATALTALGLGVPTGLALGYWRIPTSRALAFGLTLPLLIPAYVNAVAWIDLLGHNGYVARLCALIGARMEFSFSIYSIPGVILVNGLSLFPIVMWSTVIGVARLDRRLEEAALLVRSSPLPRVTFPLLTPWILTGGLFVFMISLTGFSVASLLQVNVYSVEIFTRFSAFYDVPGATAQSVPILVLGLAMFGAWSLYMSKRRAWLSGTYRPLQHVPLTRKCHVLAALSCWALVAVAGVLPVAAIIERSLPLTTYLTTWQTARGEIGTSLLIASASATLLTALAVAMAFLHRARVRTRAGFALCILPFLVSGPVIGIGLILLWNHAGPLAAIYDSLAVVVLACGARFLFLAYLILRAAMDAVSEQLEEAAAVTGVSWSRRFAFILLPLVLPAVVAVWGLGFLLAFSELDATVLVCPPGSTTLPVRLFTMMHYGPSQTVAALSVVIMAVMLTGSLVVYALVRTRKALRHARH